MRLGQVLLEQDLQVQGVGAGSREQAAEKEAWEQVQGAAAEGRRRRRQAVTQRQRGLKQYASV